LKRELVGHDVKTAPEMGWASKRNGELLRLAVSRFDVFLTADRNLSYQQDVSAFDIAVVVLAARGNRLDDLRPSASRGPPNGRASRRDGRAELGRDATRPMNLLVQPMVDESPIEPFIDGSEKLLRLFGYWPSFHERGGDRSAPLARRCRARSR
jgi:hypothetical protein